MSNSHSLFSVEYSYILSFISKCASQYQIPDRNGENSVENESSRIFFSATFLAEKNWSVVPLWGTDLTQLIGDDGLHIDLTDRLSDLCMHSNVDAIYYAMLEEAEKIWYADFPTFAIAGKKIPLSEGLDGFFKIRGQGRDKMGPYMGNSILWPSDESFAIYLDGDNLAFIAGDLRKIEGLLQVRYKYCMEQYLAFNFAQQTTPHLYLGLASFCNDNLQKDLS